MGMPSYRFGNSTPRPWFYVSVALSLKCVHRSPRPVSTRTSLRFSQRAAFRKPRRSLLSSRSPALFLPPRRNGRPLTSAFASVLPVFPSHSRLAAGGSCGSDAAKTRWLYPSTALSNSGTQSIRAACFPQLHAPKQSPMGGPQRRICTCPIQQTDWASS